MYKQILYKRDTEPLVTIFNGRLLSLLLEWCLPPPYFYVCAIYLSKKKSVNILDKRCISLVFHSEEEKHAKSWVFCELIFFCFVF